MRIFFLISILILSLSDTLAYIVKDAKNNLFEFDSEPNVATISPSATHAIYAVGAEKFLVAVSRYCDYPKDVKSKEKIGGILDIDYEKIITLRPDLLLMPAINDDSMQRRLKKFGIKCFFIHNDGFEHIADDLRLVGALFNKKAQADVLADDFEKFVTSISQKKLGNSKKALFIFYGNIAAGKGSFVDGIMEILSLDNCARKIGKPWPMLSREFILNSNIDILFVELPPNSNSEFLLAQFKNDSVWKNVPAVKNNSVYFIPRELIVVPSIRVKDAITLMGNYLKDTN